ncbi:MAG: mechanosensitive ion channel family protein [candidate division Zixibacteria bacterium]|nr:mechanosensitive ion channel family protein [candidate division Zixibacteria bacterium]MCI0595329.1 mechanosensitive ion channel family protein [candidate division Zixibacteria bacterium]
MSFEQWLPYLIPAGLVVLCFSAGLFVQRVVLGRVARLAQATTARYDDLLIQAVRGPVVLWFLILGIYFAVKAAPLPPELKLFLGKLSTVVILFSATWVLARLAGGLADEFSAQAGGALPKTSIFKIIARLAVLAVGFLVILQTLGISITPILTALGVGGLAVALALQDTLSNLFAGLQILAARQIRVGDFVRLESGEEGYVTDITWRHTTIRMLPNNRLVVPNAKLAAAVVLNYYLPDTELAVLVPVGVSYDSDLERVERVTIEVAAGIMKTVAGGVPEFAPFIRYNEFDDFSINFTVILRGREVVDQHLIKHEFIKALHRRYRQEGIEIPFPVRTVQLKRQEEQSGRRKGLSGERARSSK